ncbi:MAG: fused isobutyryl-CoA mutase/GTPase IcmF [Myxococcota bacterium]|nr:fused isobutyryl-CoA mutase/GTPase IcmF [Myxococcota bacterium]
MNAPEYQIKNKLRVVTAASLFDGHDAAINIMRRLIQDGGAEVIHLGHNRAVQEVVQTAIQEDAHAIALSSYQGGHVEYFKYTIDLLKKAGCEHIKVFGGGGGVIIQEEIDTLQEYGVERIYSPEDGRKMGLIGMIADLLKRSDRNLLSEVPQTLDKNSDHAIARAISFAEEDPSQIQHLLKPTEHSAPVVGITGTGGAGKSSLTDELIRRYLSDFPEHRIGILSIDPSRRRTGGALLGDRIRMNAVRSPRCFARSLATRAKGVELSAATQDAIRILQTAGMDLILVETSGIGQGSSSIIDISDFSMYVMTPEYGAPSQLEKIDMLDFADLVVLNKFDRRGSEDALRDVRKQVRRNRKLWETPLTDLPVFGTIASQFNDTGVNAAYLYLLERLSGFKNQPYPSIVPASSVKSSPAQRRIIPPERNNYLRDIAISVRTYHAESEAQAQIATRHANLTGTLQEFPDLSETIKPRADQLWNELLPIHQHALDGWSGLLEKYTQEFFVYQVRGKEIKQPLYIESLSHLSIPRVALPRYQDPGDRLRWLAKENLPGYFPYTAGVFPLKRKGEEPKRMFAGEGGPFKTNARFHFLCKGETVHRLSTAFDSVTLYGEDPAHRPDIFGKVGESGVSIATLDDMKELYRGFDLCAKTTSVSMTINGPAPILLAMYMNTAIDQQHEAFEAREGRSPSTEEYALLKAYALKQVRGTVQADILKEDQAQNTCIFSLDFALKMMGDIQQYFIDHEVRNYYSVSISGYHIAEAGANPISQLAFTLSNGFTLVEYYRSRGMDINSFAPSLSFFFSNGMDPEYTVIGRVARRIWAVAMKKYYKANSRSQKLKYHIQTSGRSLHAREIQFNDIRTTLQALLALYDNCNSLHTNAYDEAITTPTEESVRRAMAIQKIINHEFGLLKNENALQGSFIVEELTDLVEEAVLKEFEQIDRRGGVLGAMETQYQRGKIQEESLYYEHKKHSGELPIIGINTFLDPKTTGEDWTPPSIELRRSTYEEKEAQINRLRDFQTKNEAETTQALQMLRQTALSDGNIFEALMHCVRVASLGQITHTLYQVGGEYRRNL